MVVYHEVIRAQLNKYKGVEMQADGDAVLLGFRDPISAVAWALATQQVCFLHVSVCWLLDQLVSVEGSLARSQGRLSVFRKGPLHLCAVCHKMFPASIKG